MNRETKTEIYIRPVREILQLLSTTTEDVAFGGARVRSERRRSTQDVAAETERPSH